MPSKIAYKISESGYTPGKEGVYVPKYDSRMILESEKAGFYVENLWPFIKLISCPTLIVRGEKSQFLLVEEAIKLAASIPNAILRNIPNATHMPLQENSIAFCTVIREFLYENI